MMREVHRVLRPGGRFVAELGGHGNIAAIRVAFIAVLERHGFADRENDVNYYPTPDAYTRRLTRHGFTRREDLAHPPPHAAWRRRHARLASAPFAAASSIPCPIGLRETVVDETVALLANALRDEEGKWTADYVRLRFIARR